MKEETTYTVYQLYGPEEGKETFDVEITQEISVRVRKGQWFYWQEQYFTPTEDWGVFGENDQYAFYIQDGVIFFGVGE